MTRAVTLPGFVNAHSHAFQRALRGRAAGGDFWAWRDGMLAEAERQTPDTVRASSHGKVCLAPTLDVDISSSRIRAALHAGLEADANALAMAQVLDYIQQHNLYKN